MLFVAVVLFGFVSLFRMPVSLFPDIAFPRLVVWTTVLETGPAEVERRITEPIEEALATTPGVRSIQSISREGQSLVTVQFPWGTDMDFAQLHVRERIDEILEMLPDHSERPTILRVDPSAEPLLVASATPAPGESMSLAHVQVLATTSFRRRLEQLEGVARVVAVGLDRREVVVEVDPLRLESQGLTIEAVSTVLRQANASASGGTIGRRRHRYPLRAHGELEGPDETAEVVVVQSAAGGTVRLADVAAVRDTVAERVSAAYFDGRPSVGLLVFKESEANAVSAAGAAVDAFRHLENRNPGVEIDIVNDQSTFVTEAIRNLVIELVAGGLLAFLILFPFLRDPRWPAAIAIAMPISIIGAFGLLDASGVSFNIMSLGGLALGVGLLVDNSIVVLENVFRHREQGLAASAAAAIGAEEVQGAVTASTLTTIAVFGPIVYARGLAGALFRELALAIAFSLIASLAVALTLLPAMAARLGDRSDTRDGRKERHWFARATDPLFIVFERGFGGLATRYERALTWSLDHRREVLAATAILLVATVALGFSLQRDVLPMIDHRSFSARLALPLGTPLDETERVALSIDRWLRARTDVEAVLTRVGRASALEIEEAESRGPNTAVLDVRLGENGASTSHVMDRLRAAFADLPAGSLDLETGRGTEVGRILGTAEHDAVIEIAGTDLDLLRVVADSVVRRLVPLDRLEDVASSFEEGQPEIRISIDREAVARHGFTVDRVVREVADRTRGRAAMTLAGFDHEVPVVIRFAGGERRDLERVLTSTIEGIRLGTLVHAEELVGPVTIERGDQRRIVRVTADLSHGGLSDAISEIERALEGLSASPDVKVTVGGGGEELARSLRALALAFLLAIALVYLILAAQFESLVQPLIILLAVPLALVGAVLALAVTGHGIDTMSGIGIVVLIGIVDNDAIIKVEFINRSLRKGLDLPDAIHAAGCARLRPIVITSLTTILGVLPMALGFGAGSELYAPLAIALLGGMTTSTVLTLLVIPVLYSVVAERATASSPPRREP
jgi:HAE1 family hydrophobic/amphiphilic exporter-1